MRHGIKIVEKITPTAFGTIDKKENTKYNENWRK
jgi:hypothetical protein